MRAFLFAVMSLFMLSACAAQKETLIEKRPAEAPGDQRFDESFDPLSLDDDDIVISREDSPVTVRKAETEKTAPQSDRFTTREAEGFRVQIIATRSIEAATVAQQKALDQFTDLNYKVYLIYEAPLYRIRIGDALTRREADQIRDVAKQRGYDEAFIVRSKVLVSDNPQE